MKSPYFCARHAKRIVADEAYAFVCWNEMMRSGLLSYHQCRSDTAENYFGAALDIAFLRSTCEHNKNFCAAQMIKPAEFLFTLYLANSEIDKAKAVMGRFQGVLDKHTQTYSKIADINPSLTALKRFVGAQNAALSALIDEDRLQHRQDFYHAASTLH